MKRMYLMVVFVLSFSGTVYGSSFEADHAKITSLFDSPVYRGDSKIKITSFEYKPESGLEANFKGKKATKRTEGWRTNIMVVSSHEYKMDCEITGYFTLAGGKRDSSARAAILYSGELYPDEISRYTSGVVINMNSLSKLKSFVIESSCERAD